MEKLARHRGRIIAGILERELERAVEACGVGGAPDGRERMAINFRSRGRGPAHAGVRECMREETGHYDEFLNLALAASDLIAA